MTNHIKGYAVLGMRECVEAGYEGALGSDYQFVNLKTLEADLRAKAEALGTAIGNLDTGYYDESRTEWYAAFTEYYCVEVDNNRFEAWEWFSGINIDSLMGGDAQDPCSYRYSMSAKGQRVKE